MLRMRQAIGYSGIFRSLKTIHLQEELSSQRRILHPDFFLFYTLRCIDLR